MTKKEAIEELTKYVARSSISSYVHTYTEDKVALEAIAVLTPEE